MRSLTFCFVSFVLIVGGGCKARSTSATSDRDAAVTTTQAVVESAPSEFVPAEMKGALRFQVINVKAKASNAPSFDIATPVDWKESMPDQIGWLAYKGPLGKGQMNFMASCDGFCGPKAWESLIERKLFDARKNMKVLLDERRPNEHLQVRQPESTFADEPIDVVFARWKDGASEYLYCEARLEGGLRASYRAFGEACRGMKATTWP